MTITLRPGTAADAGRAAHLLRGFHGCLLRAQFPAGLSVGRRGRGLMRCCLSIRASTRRRRAEGRIVGSNFIDERIPHLRSRPDPRRSDAQNRGIGRAVDAGRHRSRTRREAAGVRLLQAGFHNRSLCLYSLARLQDARTHVDPPGQAARSEIRRLRRAPRYAGRPCRLQPDLPPGPWLRPRRRIARRDRPQGRTGRRPPRPHRGYTTGISFFAHTVAETNHGLMALIGAAPNSADPASCCRPATTRSSTGA